MATTTSVTTTSRIALGAGDGHAKQLLDDARRRAERPAWKALLGGLIAGSLALVAYAWLAAAWDALPVLLMLVMAASLVGSLLGFLFGIPGERRDQVEVSATGEVRTNPPAQGSVGAAAAGDRQDGEPATGATVERKARSARLPYRPSNSLEQIAEWLTKVLIGASLVQLHELAAMLGRLGLTVAGAFADRPPGIAVAAQATVVGFSVTGFLAGYLWARLHYGAIQAQVDSSILDALTETDEKADAANQKATAADEKAVDLYSRMQRMLEAIGSVAKQALPSDVGPARRETGSGVTLPEEGRADAEAAARMSPAAAAAIQEFERSPVDWAIDPAGDLFPEASSEARGRRLAARIVTDLGNALIISIEVTRFAGTPLTGVVTFLLHPTFTDRVQHVQVHNDVAELSIHAVGAFTVVALADDGATVLKLDLVSLSGAPRWFVGS